MPENNAEVGDVNTHCPALVSNCFANPLPPIAKIIIATPGRPSGVSEGSITLSIAPSHPQAITDVANPVIACAEIIAHFSF